VPKPWQKPLKTEDIMSKCNCFDESLEKVKAHVQKSIGDNATEFSASWEGYSYFIDGGDHIPVNPKVNYQYRGVKRDGSAKTKLTKDTISIFVRFCPFCGRDTKEEVEA
jgi:hypothetical protein